jgi:hypothetical protein
MLPALTVKCTEGIDLKFSTLNNHTARWKRMVRIILQLLYPAPGNYCWAGLESYCRIGKSEPQLKHRQSIIITGHLLPWNK